MEFLLQVFDNMKWLFSGVGILIVGWLFKWFFSRKEIRENHNSDEPPLSSSPQGATSSSLANESPPREAAAALSVLFFSSASYTL